MPRSMSRHVAGSGARATPTKKQRAPARRSSGAPSRGATRHVPRAAGTITRGRQSRPAAQRSKYARVSVSLRGIDDAAPPMSARRRKRGMFSCCSCMAISDSEDDEEVEGGVAELEPLHHANGAVGRAVAPHPVPPTELPAPRRASSRGQAGRGPTTRAQAARAKSPSGSVGGSSTRAARRHGPNGLSDGTWAELELPTTPGWTVFRAQERDRKLMWCAATTTALVQTCATCKLQQHSLRTYVRKYVRTYYLRRYNTESGETSLRQPLPAARPLGDDFPANSNLRDLARVVSSPR